MPFILIMLDALLTPLLVTGELIATYLVDANQRIYWLYSVIAIVMAVMVFHAKKLSYKALLSPQIWWHQSARHDYVIFFINRLLKTLGVIPVLLVMAPLAIGFSGWLEDVFGAQTFLDFPSWVIIGIFTLVLFVIDDFTRFFLHYLLHKIPFLWEFHKVHHSAKVLTPMTIYRSHPVESLLYGSRMILSQGVAVGICYYFFGPTLSMFDVLGANVFVFVFNIMGSNLRHSHVWLSWGENLEK
ncbi:MAG: sterol desaturase family protein, partial [Psychrobium sp.]